MLYTPDAARVFGATPLAAALAFAHVFWRVHLQHPASLGLLPRLPPLTAAAAAIADPLATALTVLLHEVSFFPTKNAISLHNTLPTQAQSVGLRTQPLPTEV